MNENEILKTETLSDIIQRGVAIREKRVAEERARIIAEEEAQQAKLAEDERMIRNLLPQAIVELAEVDIRGSRAFQYAYVRISYPFPGMGSVKIYAKKDQYGQWWLEDYEAVNPDGYFLRFSTLEEALAYAAGCLEVSHE